MGKTKKKPIKGNIAKKQLKKKQLKQKIKIKNKVLQPKQKQMTVSQLKKLLYKLPILVFEPEIQALCFSRTALERAQGKYEEIPLQINHLSDEIFQDSFKKALVAIGERTKSQQSKQMLVQTLLYYIDSEEQTPAANHLIVAIYYASLQTIESTDQILAIVKEYEIQWGEYIQAKFEVPQEEEEELPQLTETPSIKSVSAWENIENDFLTSLDSNQPATQLIEDDLDTFLHDYCEQQKINDINDLSKLQVRRFVQTWFPENISPTEEDKKQIITSLLTFFSFIQTSKHASLLETDTLSAIINFLNL